jgi:hypothetical protein
VLTPDYENPFMGFFYSFFLSDYCLLLTWRLLGHKNICFSNFNKIYDNGRRTDTERNSAGVNQSVFCQHYAERRIQT